MFIFFLFLVHEIGIADLKAFEDFLGNKKYLMGDRICNEDASIFGGIAQVVNHDRGPFNKYIMGMDFLLNFNKFFKINVYIEKKKLNVLIC